MQQNTHNNGIRHKHDDYDHKETRYVRPGPLQCGCENVHLGVQSEQVPQFDSSHQDQEANNILERCVCHGNLIKTGKSTWIVKMWTITVLSEAQYDRNQIKLKKAT